MIYNALEIMTPLLIAGLGGLFTELAGVLNIALEGLMLAGAFAAIVGTAATGSLLAGIISGVGAATLLAALYAYFTTRLRANIFIAGLAVNLFSAGVIPFISTGLYGTKGVLKFDAVGQIPHLFGDVQGHIPILHDIFFGHNVTVYLALLLVFLVYLILYRTPFGLRLRALGKNEELLTSRGLRPERYRVYAILISGVACGLAGSALSLRLGVYLPNITAGRGWIALVTIYLGYRHPLGILLAAFFFAVMESLAGAAQGLIHIPGTVLLGVPYAVTVIAMVIYSIVRHNRLRRQRLYR